MEFGISIHALRVEGDERSRATRAAADHISIHALRVEGDFKHTVPENIGYGISIHALRVEGDTLDAPYRSGSSDFYPRPPGGGRRK